MILIDLQKVFHTTDHDILGRWVGLFRSHTNIQKKIIYNMGKELQKPIKKSMVTGIAQKSHP